MKNILLVILVLLTNVFSCYAQNTIHPAPLVFTYKSVFSGSDTTAPLSVKQFPQKEFIKGWQWSGRDKITDAMHANFPVRPVAITARYHIPLQRLVPDWASFRMDRYEVRRTDILDT